MQVQTILGLLTRHALTALGGFLVAQGYIGADDVPALVGAGVSLAGVAWSFWQKKAPARRAY